MSPSMMLACYLARYSCVLLNNICRYHNSDNDLAYQTAIFSTCAANIDTPIHNTSSASAADAIAAGLVHWQPVDAA